MGRSAGRRLPPGCCVSRARDTERGHKWSQAGIKLLLTNPKINSFTGMAQSQIATGVGLAVVGTILLVVIGSLFLGVAGPTDSKDNKTSTSKRLASKSSSSSSSSSSKRASKTSDDDDEDDDEDDDSKEVMRGYKTKANGSRTTYFNRELSDDDKRLLAASNSGPQRIVEETTLSPAAAPVVASSSKWNSAGTFEEKNVQDWAHAKLKALLRTASFQAPDGGPRISVTSVHQVTGDCIVASSRGKTKFIFDLEARLQWEVASLGSTVSGSMELQDITADGAETVSHSVSVSTTSSSKAVQQYIRSTSQGLQPVLAKQLEQFFLDLRREHQLS